MDGVTLKEETKMKPALFAVPALFVLFPAAIGFGIAEAIHRGTGFSGYCNVIDSDIKDRSLYWLYLAVVLFAWTTRWLNSFPMGLKNAAVESHGKMAKGNVRANMYLYQNLEGGLVVLEEDGAAGQYNRANRSLHHFIENVPGLALCLLLAGFVYPAAVFILTAIFVLGRIAHQTGYAIKGYGGHGLGFAIALIATVSVEGLVLVAGLRAAGCGL